jgi:DNA-binding transcriptional regulator YhcF (GntR family)
MEELSVLLPLLPQLGAFEWCTLVVIATEAKNDRAQLSDACIARRIRASESTVERAIRRLVARNLISIERQKPIKVYRFLRQNVNILSSLDDIDTHKRQRVPQTRLTDATDSTIGVQMPETCWVCETRPTDASLRSVLQTRHTDVIAEKDVSTFVTDQEPETGYTTTERQSRFADIARAVREKTGRTLSREEVTSLLALANEAGDTFDSLLDALHPGIRDPRRFLHWLWRQRRQETSDDEELPLLIG